MFVGHLSGGAPEPSLEPFGTAETGATTAAQGSSFADWLGRFAAMSAERKAFANGDEVIKLAGPIAVEHGATLTYRSVSPRAGGPPTQQFLVQVSGGIPHVTEPERSMTKAEEKAVLGSLERQIGAAGPGGPSDPDPKVLQEFVDKLRADVAGGAKPSTLFDAVHWADCTGDGHGGVTAQGGMGIDQIMTVHADKSGHLTCSTRIAGGHFASTPRPLSAADRDDLVRSVKAYLSSPGVASNSRWSLLLKDAQK
jgi:hypothetical protein